MCRNVKRAPQRRASSSVPASTASARWDPSSGTRKWRYTSAPGEDLHEQVHVESDDERGDDAGDYSRDAPVDERPHDIGPAREQDQRDDGERQAEAQHYLADHEGARGVQPQ